MQLWCHTSLGEKCSDLGCDGGDVMSIGHCNEGWVEQVEQVEQGAFAPLGVRHVLTTNATHCVGAASSTMQCNAGTCVPPIHIV